MIVGISQKLLKDYTNYLAKTPLKKEFQDYNYPDWLRDLTGIFKLTFAVMLFSGNDELVLLASAGLIILMLGAFGTHMRVKNGPRWFMPSLSQIIMNGYIFYMTY